MHLCTRSSTHDDARIQLKDEDVALSRSTTTNYKSKVGSKFLKVEQIWYFIKHYVENPSMVHTGYMKAAIADGFATVSMLDRADLIAYLTGKIATSDRIDVTVPVVADEDAEAAEKRAREAEEEEAGVVRERVLRDRNSVLKGPKDLGNVLEFFAPKEEKQKLEEQQQTAAEMAKGIKNQRYRDVKEQVFWREHVGTDFDMMNLDTNASFLTANQPTTDADELEPAMARPDKPTPQAAAAAPSTRGSHAPPTKKPRKTSGKPGGVPIIIVPAGFNSKVVLNMFNAKEFLQNGKYVHWDVIQKSGVKKSSSIIISRTYKRDQKIKYEITEKAPHKRSEDWARVAAVFVLGAKWQFKDWPFRGVEDGDFVETFSKVRGFYARFDGDPEVDIMKTWNVKPLNVSRTSRHGDRATFEAFWDELDRHLALRASALNY